MKGLLAEDGFKLLKTRTMRELKTLHLLRLPDDRLLCLDFNIEADSIRELLIVLIEVVSKAKSGVLPSSPDEKWNEFVDGETIAYGAAHLFGSRNDRVFLAIRGIPKQGERLLQKLSGKEWR